MEATIDRSTIYDQADIRDYDHLQEWRATLIALSQLAMDVFGGQTTVVGGFAATADAPADLSINLAAGSIYEMADVDAAAWGSLGSDTAQILQQGITAAQKITLTTAGLSSGQSRWALIQASFSQVDEIPADDPNGGILPYLNTSNPAGPPWSGPNNSGAAQDTRRLGAITVDVVYGTVAATGSEVPPNPTAGYVPLYLIDLSYNQTQINQSQILTAGPSVGTGVPSNYPQGPFLAGLITASPSATTSHHLGIAGHAPKVNLGTETQGTIPLSALPSGFGASGQCRLIYTSATAVALVPFNGASIKIAGTVYQIPAAGVSLSNAGLSANTTYYLYLYNNAGTLTLAASATAPTSDTTAGNIGVEIETGNNAYSYVGMVITNGSSQFAFADVFSWFNPGGAAYQLPITATGAGNWTCPVTGWYLIRGWGGGGGSSGSSSGVAAICGGGGGAFFEGRRYYTQGQSIPYAVGAGGAAVAYGATGGTGGTTSWNSGDMSATGGTGSNASQIGAGGTASGSYSTDFALTGSPGQPFGTSTGEGGVGGMSPQGAGGGSTSSGAAQNGNQPGGGAGGPGAGASEPGNTGGAGMIYIQFLG